MGEADSAPPEQLPIIVRARTATSATALVRAIEPDPSYSRTLPLFDAASALVSPSQILELSDEERVDQIWLDEPVYALLDTSITNLGIDAIWESGYTGKAIKICIVDSGVDSSHPDLSGSIMAEANFTTEAAGDLNGHGTHVAGIAAGNGAASNGLYRGVAPEASLYVAKVLNRSGAGSQSTVAAALEWAVEKEVDIVNLSFGTHRSSDGTDFLSLACNRLVEMGINVVVAAGNYGPTPSTIGSPASAEDVITVGAMTDAEEIAHFSSRGPTSDGRTKPDLLMPGVSIIAARATQAEMRDVIDSFYARESGTSMSAPHASGVIALMLQANATLSPAEIKTILLASCDPIIDVDANTQGAGRLIPARALEMALRAAAPSDPSPDDEGAATDGEEEAPTNRPANERPGCLGRLFMR